MKLVDTTFNVWKAVGNNKNRKSWKKSAKYYIILLILSIFWFLSTQSLLPRRLFLTLIYCHQNNSFLTSGYLVCTLFYTNFPLQIANTSNGFFPRPSDLRAKRQYYKGKTHKIHLNLRVFRFYLDHGYSSSSSDLNRVFKIWFNCFLPSIRFHYLLIFFILIG